MRDALELPMNGIELRLEYGTDRNGNYLLDKNGTAVGVELWGMFDNNGDIISDRP